MSKENKDLAYDKLADDAKFREQYRFAFSAAIVATVFVIPNDNPIEAFLKTAVGFSAVFAAIYLIASAARVKYNEPGRLYEIFYIGERFRMWAYDWSLHVFAAAFLFFIGLIVTGLISKVPGVQLEGAWLWIVFVGVTFIIGVIILLITNKMMTKKSKKKLPEI